MLCKVLACVTLEKSQEENVFNILFSFMLIVGLVQGLVFFVVFYMVFLDCG